jgi:hypothetical protein
MARIFVLILLLASCGPAVGPDAARAAGPGSAIYWNPANWDWGAAAQANGAMSRAVAPISTYATQPLPQPHGSTTVTCHTSANLRTTTCY